MKLVPKPEGYEMRSKRADKQADCGAWDAADAIYEAQQEMAGKKVSAVVVLWREVAADGKTFTYTRRAGNKETISDILLTNLGRYMGWD